MILAIILLILSLLLIVVAADQFVDGAASIAQRYHISPLVVGLTLVAFGTSAPEIAITVISALQQKSGIALGNAIGSNIANVALVMGAMLLVSPVRQTTLNKPKLAFLWLAMLLTLSVFVDHHFSRIDGVLLFILLFAFFIYLYFSYRRFSEARLEKVTYHEEKTCPWFRVAFGSVLLPLMATIAVQQAVVIAKLLGLSEVTIGLTVIAIGTSLPELATSLTSSIKGHHDIAIGNIIGSNIFNLLLVLPFIGLLDPSTVTSDVIYRDMPVMLVTALSVFALTLFSTKWLRVLGGLLLVSYVVYLTLLVTS